MPINEKLYSVSFASLTPQEQKMVETWLAKNNPVMDIAAEAVRKPVFAMPMIDFGKNHLLTFDQSRHVFWCHDLAQMWYARAKYRIATENIDGAIDDIVSGYRLGRLITKQKTMTSILIGQTLEGMGLRIGIGNNQKHPPTIAQLKRLQLELNDLEEPFDVSEIYVLERLVTLASYQCFAHAENPFQGATLEEEMWKHYKWNPTKRKLGIDWNSMLERINQYYDFFEGEKETPPATPKTSSWMTRKGRSNRIIDDDFYGTPFQNNAKAIHLIKNIKAIHRITLAMLIYHSGHGALPPAWTVDENGKPLQSWRVLLLPYLNEGELYAKIRLNEPWDSEHNRLFHQQMPVIYQYYEELPKSGETVYSVIVDEETLFRNDGTSQSFSDLESLNPEMILLVQATSPFCWMDPTKNVAKSDFLKQVEQAEDSIEYDARNGAVHSIDELEKENTLDRITSHDSEKE